jgi:GT2 family glycosyltransferase
VTPRGSRIAAVVLARSRPAHTKRTLDALLTQDPPSDVLLLVDNDATPEVSALLAEAAAMHPDGNVLRLESNRGCGGGYEAGLAQLLGRDDIDFICGFDDDAMPFPGCLGALRDAALELPDAAEVGAMAHDEDGTLAWPMYLEGRREPLRTVSDVEATELDWLPVINLAWQGLMFPVEILRRHGNVWGELFLQYEDIELGLRYKDAGLRCYLVPAAECLHPAPPPARELSILGRKIDVTRQDPVKEYLTLRNGLVVWHRYDGLRFWYGSGPFVLLRGLLSSLSLGTPRLATLRHVFLRGLADAITGRMGPPPRQTVELAARDRSRRSVG